MTVKICVPATERYNSETLFWSTRHPRQEAGGVGVGMRVGVAMTMRQHESQTIKYSVAMRWEQRNPISHCPQIYHFPNFAFYRRWGIGEEEKNHIPVTDWHSGIRMRSKEEYVGYKHNLYKHFDCSIKWSRSANYWLYLERSSHIVFLRPFLYLSDEYVSCNWFCRCKKGEPVEISPS